MVGPHPTDSVARAIATIEPDPWPQLVERRYGTAALNRIVGVREDVMRQTLFIRAVIEAEVNERIEHEGKQEG